MFVKLFHCSWRPDYLHWQVQKYFTIDGFKLVMAENGKQDIYNSLVQKCTPVIPVDPLNEIYSLQPPSTSNLPQYHSLCKVLCIPQDLSVLYIVILPFLHLVSSSFILIVSPPLQLPSNISPSSEYFTKLLAFQTHLGNFANAFSTPTQQAEILNYD